MVAIQTMAMASTPKQDNTGLKINGSIMKQHMFNWNAKVKYEEPQNFKLEVNNMLQNYNLHQTEKVSIIRNWQGREGLQLVATLTQDEQEACNNEKSLFNMLNRKFKPHYNETMKSLQFCKLVGQSNEIMEE